jgi:hypothetical protein
VKPDLGEEEGADGGKRGGEPAGKQGARGEADHGERHHFNDADRDRPQRRAAPGRVQRGVDVDRRDPGEEREQQPEQRGAQRGRLPRPGRPDGRREQVIGLTAALP